MRVAAAHPLEIDAPAWAHEARDAEILARAGGDPPACQRCTSSDRRAALRCLAKQTGGDTRRVGSPLTLLRVVTCIIGNLTSHPAQTGTIKPLTCGKRRCVL